MTSDYLFVRLLLLAGAVMGGLVVLIVIVLMLGTGSGSPLAFTLHCSLSSTTSFDAIVHAIALACGLVAIAPLVSGLRAAAQARAGIAQLRQAAPIANHGMSPRVIHAAVATGLTDRVEVVDLARPLAFTYGWLQPRVCLSTALIERLVDDELEAVLYHEAWHVLRRDPLRLIVVKLFNDAFFFVPDLARLAHLHSLTVEIAADRYVVVQMGHSRALAKALAPILSFTAEETWQTLREQNLLDASDNPESVFLNTFPVGPVLPPTPAIADFLSVRRLINEAVEKARQAGTLKGANDALIVLKISGTGPDFKKFVKTDAELASVLGVAALRLEKGDGGTVVESVSLAPGAKCPRCWLWRPLGGRGLCERCDAAEPQAATASPQ